jgi:monoamine oxidase
MTSEDDVLDVIVVGGGVSGLYSAWRILTGDTQKESQRSGKKVTVLEWSKRTGGRLLTWRPPGFPEGIHGELGGMRFFEQQTLVWSLVQHFVRQGKLKPPIRFFVQDPNGNNLTYLRQRILKAADLSDPDRVPYLLDASTRYADPGSIAAGVVASILIENRKMIAGKLGGHTQPRTWEDWDNVKPLLEHAGRKLWDLGFWNLLADLLSPEGYNFVTDGFGYYSLTNNWNAAEAMQSIYLDFTQSPDYHTLEEGYDYLPTLIRREVEKNGGEVRKEHRVTRVDREQGGVFSVHISGRNTPLRARCVILAMPRKSLELLEPTAFWDTEQRLHAGKSLKDLLHAVIPYPAFKLFLAYDKPWWRTSPINIAAGRSVSDLPIRQTYYFPSVAKSVGNTTNDDDLLKGPGLLMASYDDLGAVSYWKALEVPEDQKGEARRVLAQILTSRKKVESSHRDQAHLLDHIIEIDAALENEHGFYMAPSEMVRHAQQYLRYVHYNQPIPDPMPLPGKPGEFLAAYKDWGHDPYGGGWNFWAPGIDVRDVMQTIRQPFQGIPLYIVGEAYSGSQGWVEGALTTTERVMREHLNLRPASWHSEGMYLGY